MGKNKNMRRDLLHLLLFLMFPVFYTIVWFFIHRNDDFSLMYKLIALTLGLFCIGIAIWQLPFYIGPLYIGVFPLVVILIELIIGIFFLKIAIDQFTKPQVTKAGGKT